MIKKLIFGLWLVATLSFGVTIEDGLEAVEKGDNITALTIFEDLALKGNSEAQYNLGFMYGNGQGVKQDYKKAKEWFGKACDGGIQDGCNKYKELNQQGY